MAGTLLVEPFGGLGNRMRVLVSSIKLSLELNKSLKVLWTRGPDFNCDYEKLYKPNDFFSLAERAPKSIYSSYNDSSFKRIGINFLNKLNGFDLMISDQDHSRTFFSKTFKVNDISMHDSIYVRSCEQFYGGDRWDVFQPIDSLSEIIKSVRSRYAPRTIGIHIRRTDNLKSIIHSPLTLFVELMQKELNQDPATRFFICTDDVSVKDALFQRFSNDQLIYHEKEFSRSKERGIQDALIDMHCLASCEKILGSYWSSFSEVASYLHGRQLVVADNSDIKAV